MIKPSPAALRGRLGLLRRSAQETSRKVGPNPHRERGAKKGMVLVVTGCALCGPVALLAAISGGSAASGAAAVVSSAPVDPSAAQGEQARATYVAQGFLQRYLTATQDTAQALRQQLLDPPGSMQLPQKAPAAPTSIVLSDVSRPASGTWLISLTAVGGASGAGETYQVPVRVDGSSASVITLPSRVGQVTAAGRGDVVTDTTSLDPASVAGQASVGFLKSWLTNAGDITRWTTTSFTPAPVTSQLCRQVVLTEVRSSSDDAQTFTSLATQAPSASSTPTSSSDDSTSQPAVAGSVTATVTCTTAAATQQLTYRLLLTEVAGQLVVSAVNPYRP